jgi:hypothetical protein
MRVYAPVGREVSNHTGAYVLNILFMLEAFGQAFVDLDHKICSWHSLSAFR